MSWLRLDDHYATHPKMLAAGPTALAMDVGAMCYAAAHETDGRIPAPAVQSLIPGLSRAKRTAAIERLVQVGRWEVVDGGWQIHDFLDYNPSAEERRTRREEATARVQRHRSKKRDGNTLQREEKREVKRDGNAAPHPHPHPRPAEGGDEGGAFPSPPDPPSAPTASSSADASGADDTSGEHPPTPNANGTPAGAGDPGQVVPILGVAVPAGWRAAIGLPERPPAPPEDEWPDRATEEAAKRARAETLIADGDPEPEPEPQAKAEEA